jgi:hypothetical protein
VVVSLKELDANRTDGRYIANRKVTLTQSVENRQSNPRLVS